MGVGGAGDAEAVEDVGIGRTDRTQVIYSSESWPTLTLSGVWVVKLERLTFGSALACGTGHVSLSADARSIGEHRIRRTSDAIPIKQVIPVSALFAHSSSSNTEPRHASASLLGHHVHFIEPADRQTLSGTILPQRPSRTLRLALPIDIGEPIRVAEALTAVPLLVGGAVGYCEAGVVDETSVGLGADADAEAVVGGAEGAGRSGGGAGGVEGEETGKTGAGYAVEVAVWSQTLGVGVIVIITSI